MQLMLEICKKFPLRFLLHAFSASPPLSEIVVYYEYSMQDKILHEATTDLIVTYTVYKCSSTPSPRLAIHSAVIAIQRVCFYRCRHDLGAIRCLLLQESIISSCSLARFLALAM